MGISIREMVTEYTGVGLLAECIQTNTKNLTIGKRYKVLDNYMDKQLEVTDNLDFEKYYPMTWFHILWGGKK